MLLVGEKQARVYVLVFFSMQVLLFCLFEQTTLTD